MSILSEKAVFDTFKRFGFQSGRDVDKFLEEDPRSANGVKYITDGVNAVISGKIVERIDVGSHVIFIAEVKETILLADDPSVTYDYYFKTIKPAPPKKDEKKTGYVCKICGYVYEGEVLPDDFVCPLCKHGAADFEKL